MKLYKKIYEQIWNTETKDYKLSESPTLKCVGTVINISYNPFYNTVVHIFYFEENGNIEYYETDKYFKDLLIKDD